MLVYLAGIGAGAVAQAVNGSIEAKATAGTCHLAGTMNEWNASDDNYAFLDDGSTYAVLPITGNGNTEFKIVDSNNNWLGYDSVNKNCSAYGRLYKQSASGDSYNNIGIYTSDSDNDTWRKCIYIIRYSDGVINIDLAWSYHGSDATKTYNNTSWGDGSITHYLIDGGPSVTWTMSKNEHFKLNNRIITWGDEYKAALSGTANGNTFTGGKDGETNNDIVCKHAGDYVFTLASGTLYIDFVDGTEFYYKGSDENKAGAADTAWTAHPITVNGAAVEFSFAEDETFVLVSSDGEQFGAGYLSDNYYNCFGSSDDTIVMHMTYAHYTLAVTIVDHVFHIVPSATGQTYKTNYVLDLNGNNGEMLRYVQKAHVWHNAGNDVSVGANWPGLDMSPVSGVSNVYEITYWDVFDWIQFNNGSSKTINYQNVEDGKCLILGWHSENWLWDSNDWVSLDAAKYIANYLKFDVNGADENAQGSGLCKTDGWYTAAKGAYEKLSESVQKDVCSSSLALARLQAWARVNEATFVVTDGVGAFSASRTVNMFAMNEVTNNGSLIAVIAITALAAAAGMFFVFHRKEQ